MLGFLIAGVANSQIVLETVPEYFVNSSKVSQFCRSEGVLDRALVIPLIDLCVSQSCSFRYWWQTLLVHYAIGLCIVLHPINSIYMKPTQYLALMYLLTCSLYSNQEVLRQKQLVNFIQACVPSLPPSNLAFQAVKQPSSVSSTLGLICVRKPKCFVLHNVNILLATIANDKVLPLI